MSRGAGRIRTAGLTAGLLAVALVGCEGGVEGEAEPLEQEVESVEMERGVADLDGQVLTASLSPVNEDLLDTQAGGEARLEVRGDSLIITVDATGLPPDMMHLQHFHGFEDGSVARCPSPDADANDDGVIDVTETAQAAGSTMVPFHGDPLSMEIQAESYPRADSSGRYSYRQAVPLDSLRSAFQQTFGTADLALDQRVVFIHGVPDDVELPESAASVPAAPARITLPIACGELEATPGG